MHPNTTKPIQTCVSRPMGWARCNLCENFWRNFVAHTFVPIVPVQHSMHQVSSMTETIPNAPKHHQTHQNMSLGTNMVDRLLKILTRLRGMNFCIICPRSAKMHRVSCSNEAILNTPKHYETLQNIILGSNGVDRVRSLRKIPTQLHRTNFCTNCTSSAQSAPSFIH
jgi:hypothetical protein